jgi:hypothetical protein
MPFARRGLVFEPPRITVLLKLVNDVISNAKPLCLIEFMPQAANQLTGAPQREGHSKPEHVPACSHGKACLEQKENEIKEDANSPVNYFFVYRREQIILAAAEHQIPGVYFLHEFAESGGDQPC